MQVFASQSKVSRLYSILSAARRSIYDKPVYVAAIAIFSRKSMLGLRRYTGQTFGHDSAYMQEDKLS